MAKSFDILGLGAVAIDDLVILREFPQPDRKYSVAGRERHAGGLTGTALVAAARMGRSTAYAGSLGNDEASQFIERRLREEGVSTEYIVRREGARPFHSTILIDAAGRTRTILCDSQDVIGADDESPEEELIRSARVLFVDHVGLKGMIRAATIARKSGIPIVADFEARHPPPFDELFAMADHLILPLDFALEMSGAGDGKRAVAALWGGGRSVVAVTAGSAGSFYMSSAAPGEVRHQPAFVVRVVDTTGCGDVFHGAYSAALCEGMGVDERMRFAAAAAALKATRTGGQVGIPSREDVDSFLRERA